MSTVLVLAGGPDAEHEVSIDSATAIANALRESGTHEVHHHVIAKNEADDFERTLAGLPGDVVFPALHGLWGEGGPVQDLLEADGRPYVGSGPAAARLAMDKVTTKLYAADLGIPTPLSAILGPLPDRCPLPLPVVLKPTHEGSSVGLYLCYTDQDWAQARDAAMADSRATGRAYLVERLVGGIELTVPLLGSESGSAGLEALPVIQITPAAGTYDYAAKYTRGDTVYTVDPDLADGVSARLQRDAVALAERLGVRHLARVDYMLPADGEWAQVPQLLEVNTMPGFTSTSLLPKAAAHTQMSFAELCDHLVHLARSP
ncbi:MAG: D-alanine-D-alanine ligase [Phycisphaerales bacterium]